MVDQKLSDIPLIFGSSVGFSTLTNYSGPMFHMVTSQDTLSSYLLRLSNGEELVKVSDAPSIAVITLQLLGLLECSQVILVGQNLAYRGEQFYADGIGYKHRTTELSDKDIEDAVTVKDVYGNTVLTNPGFNRMRLSLEAVIASRPELKVVNTTKGGANISGAPFKELKTVISEDLTNTVVQSEWVSAIHNEYDLAYLRERLDKLDQQFQLMLKHLSNVINELNTIEKCVKQNNENELRVALTKFDKDFKKLDNNDFHRILIRPMNRVQYEFLVKNIALIRIENSALRKGQLIVDAFGKYIFCVKEDLKRFNSVYENMKQDVLTYLE